MPIFAIYIAILAYAHNLAAHQIDFVASLPMVVSDGAASILPFLAPYKDFMIAYMRGFVEALTSTFGMGTNGYLMVVIFAYIGGLIAEQTRREMGSRSGSGSSLGVNLVQPILGGRPYIDDEEEAYDEDEEVHRSRHPVRARAHGHAVPVGAPGRTHHRRGHADYLEFLRKIPAEVGVSGGYRLTRPRHQEDEDAEDDDEEGEEIVAPRTHRVSHAHATERREHHRPAHPREAEDDEETESPEPPARAPHMRTQAEERAIQRFVERALKNYDHSKL